MMRRRRELWIGGLLFAFLFGLTVSKPPPASLREKFPSHSSSAILASAGDNYGAAAASYKDCRDVSSRGAGGPRVPYRATCEPTP